MKIKNRVSTHDIDIIWNAVKKRNLQILDIFKDEVSRLPLKIKKEILLFAILDGSINMAQSICDWCSHSFPENIESKEQALFQIMKSGNLGNLILYIKQNFPELCSIKPSDSHAKYACLLYSVFLVFKNKSLDCSEKEAIRYLDKILDIPTSIKEQMGLTKDYLNWLLLDSLHHSIKHEKIDATLAIAKNIPSGYKIAFNKAISNNIPKLLNSLFENIRWLYSSIEESKMVFFHEVTSKLLKSETDKQNFKDHTMLYFARQNNLAITKFTISKGANPAFANSQLILILIRNNSYDFAKELIKSHTKKFASNKELIVTWAFHKWIEVFADREKQLVIYDFINFIKETWDINSTLQSLLDDTLIEFVRNNDYKNASRLIVFYHARPETYQSQSLAQAVINSTLEMAELLSKYGASCKDNDFLSLELAIKNNKLDVVKFFLQDVIIDIPIKYRMAKLAVENGNIAMITLLMEGIALKANKWLEFIESSIILKNYTLFVTLFHTTRLAKIEVMTLLKCAAAFGHIEIIKFLVNKLEGKLTQEDVMSVLIYPLVARNMNSAEFIAKLDSRVARAFYIIKQTNAFKDLDLLFDFLSFEFGETIIKHEQKNALNYAVRIVDNETMPEILSFKDPDYPQKNSYVKELIIRGDHTLFRTYVPELYRYKSLLETSICNELYLLANHKIKLELLKQEWFDPYNATALCSPLSNSYRVGDLHLTKIMVDSLKTKFKEYSIESGIYAEKFDNLCKEYIKRNKGETDSLKSIMLLGSTKSIVSFGYRLPLEIGMLIIEACFKATSFPIPHHLECHGVYLSKDCINFIHEQLLATREKFCKLDKLYEKAVEQFKTLHTKTF